MLALAQPASFKSAKDEVKIDNDIELFDTTKKPSYMPQSSADDEQYDN